MTRLAWAAVVLLVVAGAGYWVVSRPSPGPAFVPADDAGAVDVARVPSPSLADSTLERFEAFRAGALGDRLVLGGAELTSLARFALPGMLPPGVREPTVSLAGGQVHVTARVARGALPRLPELEGMAAMLPDTIPVDLRGSLAPLDQAQLALVVDRIRAASVPLPPRMISDVLRALQRSRRPGVPPDVLPVPLPDGVSSAFVQRDSLVLVLEPRPEG